MAFQKIEIHSINYDKTKEALRNKVPTDQEYKSILEHLRQLETGEVTGKPVGKKRQVKLMFMLSAFFKHYGKASNTITKEELSKFKENLLNNHFLKIDGTHYSDSTKEDLTETIARYLEWKYPKKVTGFMSRTNQPLRKWFCIRGSKKTPETLTEIEVKNMYKEAKTLRGKYIVAGLFGSGCRIEEFLNLRFEDFEEPTSNFQYYKVDIKEEYSKTEGRKIGMYWDLCTESISKYLSSVEKKDMKDRVLDMEYDSLRIFLARLGRRTLNKKTNPHMMRKSSATFYASKLNRQQLCVRFGWKFKSEMPDIYISRSGVDEVDVKKIMLRDDISKLKEESNTQQEQIKKLAEVIYYMNKNLLKRKTDNKTEALAKEVMALGLTMSSLDGNED